MRKQITLILMMFLGTLFYVKADEKPYSIQVIDSKSSEPLPFATVVINKNPRRGVVSNLNGKAEFFLSEKDTCIQVSYVGYNPKSIQKENISDIIRLETIQVKLEEVVVYARENPAHRIIKKAVANRKINNPDKIPEYGCNIYNKAIYNYDFSTKDSLTEILKLLTENYVMIMESATERFYKAPGKSFERIKKVRVSGFKEPSFAPLSTDIQPFHFYKPLIEIFDISYLNPISPGSHNKYFFLMEDTLYSNADTTFIISYKPKKNTNFEGLKGFVHINTNGFAIENVVAMPADERVMEMHIQQKYKYANGYWFPEEIKSELKWKNLYNMGFGMNFKSESYVKNFRVDIPKDSVKYTEEVMVFDKLATKDAKLEMEKYRNVELNLKEKNSYAVMDSIGDEQNFEYWLRFSEKIAEGKIPMKKFFIPLDKIYTYNDFEGTRIGMGLYADDKLIPWMEIGGWGAYGFKDKEWKYGGDMKIFFDHKKETQLSAGYMYDAVFPGNEDFARKRSYFEGYFLEQADYTTKMNLSFETRIRYLQLKFNLLKDHRTPQYAYSFWLNNNWVNEYDLTEVGVQIRFAYKEKYLWQFKQKIAFETKWPVLTMAYKKGLNNFMDGEITYDKLWVQLDYSHHFARMGKTEIRVEAGKIWGNVPYSFLFSGAGGWNSSVPFVVNNRFNTMAPNTFTNDEIINFYFRHNFGTRLFSTSKWKPKLMLTQAIGIGQLSNRDIHQGISLTDMNKGYHESGLVINDIIRVSIFNFCYVGVGTGVFYNYGVYSSDTWEDNIKLKVSGNISF